jgi:hypothetical protein
MTIFAVSSIMLMWNLVNFWFPWQLLRFLRFTIVIPSHKKVLYKQRFRYIFYIYVFPYVSYESNLRKFCRTLTFYG